MELAILDFIAANLHNPFLDWLMPLITHLGDKGIIWILLGLALLLLPKERGRGVQVLLALLFSVIVCNMILKEAVGRIRPFDVQTGIELLIAAPHDFSFPSGHTSASFAAATVLMLTRWRWRYGALILAILIAVSRLYLYVHYPTDVLGGLVLGVLLGALSVFLYGRFDTWRQGKKETP